MINRKIDIPRIFSDQVGLPLRSSVFLRDHSNFRIGGEADYFFEATSIKELVSSIHVAREHSFPYYIIGGGNNILFDDNGFRGLIIKNGAKGIKQGRKETEIEVLSGTPLKDLLQFLVEKELSNLEFLAGIPGTIGGAVFGNAGAFEQSIGDFLLGAVLLSEKGKQVKVQRDYFEFSYRQSVLRKKQEILLKAVFELKKGGKDRIKALMDENLKKRENKHPSHSIKCAGSYFKNPVLPSGEKIPAATLLEKVGAKNMRVGGAAVYSGHSNFIINQKQASARDVIQLAEKLKYLVREKFGVDLEEEVIFLPADPAVL
jgi:UDP-N-acetylmuramate dehydrogenase